MSRPSAASYTVPTWATNTNYPAGGAPWSGQPIKVAFASPAGGFVPGSGAAAEYFNKLFFDTFGTDTSAKTYFGTLADGLGQADVINWTQEPTFNNVFGPTYDTVNHRWIASASTGGGDLPWISYDGGQVWVSTSWSSTPTNKPVVGSNPAGLVVGVDGASNKAYWLPASSPSTFSNTTAGIAGHTVFYRDVVWLASGSVFLAAGRESGIGSHLIKSTGTAAWTDLTASIPGTVNSIHDWSADASPTRAVFIPKNAAMGVNYMTTDDGTTFTLRTTLPITTNFVPKAVHYNATQGLWMFGALFVGGSANQLNFWTSPDGLTWTVKAQPAYPNWEIYDISSLGAVWVALVAREVGLANERMTVLYSTDDGATWRPSDLSLPVATGGVDPNRNVLSAGGARLMANHAVKLAWSNGACGL